MQVSVLTLRYDATRGVLDATPLDAFVRDKVVTAVRDHFFQLGSVPHLSLVIEYRLVAPSSGTAPSSAGAATARPGRREGSARTDDLRETLTPEDRELFDLLRAWRSRVARDEGLPAYAVLTNAQLVAIARQRPASRGALQGIVGLGRKTAERYGKDLLGVLGGAAGSPDVAGAPPAAEAD